jgi:tripeptide aminopeptidase
MNRQRLLDRFLRYVRIDTTARSDVDRYPSSPGQLQLGSLVVDELHDAGIPDARQDENGIILATLPPTAAGEVPPIAFCAHLDTSPETSGSGVQPQVFENYQGGDLVLPGDRRRVIRVSEHPELAALVGRTIITSDGTTLLGADDKAGVAVIVEAAAWLVEHPEILRGPVRLCFTCDEEIGRGVDHVRPEQIASAVCYTLDGQGADTIDVETFSADLAVLQIRGVNIHPGIAKGRMVNALRVAADLIARLPRTTGCPEATEGREGFLHPFEINGGVPEVTLRTLLRDFDTAGLADWADLIRQAAAATMAEFPGSQIDLTVTTQYRNMAEGLARDPRAVGYAQRALESLGRSASLTSVRGGTDGSRLTEMGLPTPNLATGQHSPHSALEWACLEEMLTAVEWLVALARTWAEE